MLRKNRWKIFSVLSVLLIIGLFLKWFFGFPLLFKLENPSSPLASQKVSHEALKEIPLLSDFQIKNLVPVEYSQYLEERFNQERNPNHPIYLCILITGLGLSEDLLQEVFYEIPSEVGLAFSPYASDLLDQLQDAYEDDYETLLMIPQEPVDYPTIDPGPLTLLTGSEMVEKNTQNLSFILNFKRKGVIGVIGEFGSRFVNSDVPLFRMLEHIHHLGLWYFEPQSSFSSKGMTYAKALGLPFVRLDLSIQRDQDIEKMEEVWKNFIQLAHKTGWGIASLAASPKMLYKLREWLKELNETQYYLCSPTEFLRMYP